MVKESLTTNGKPVAGLTHEQRQAIREDHLRQQEAQAEQCYLAWCAAKAAVEAVRRELEG